MCLPQVEVFQDTRTHHPKWISMRAKIGILCACYFEVSSHAGGTAMMC